jgi:PAS domain S-box-containing protein
MIEEITERKQVEEAAENVQEVFWITSLNPTRVTYVSRAYEQIWGRTRDSLYKQRLPWLDGIHLEDQARVGGAIRKQTSREVSVEYRIVRPEGAICWIWGRAFPIRNERGKVSRIIGVATDVTERNRLEREILEISAREQRRIGQDLHDGLGQHLTGISFLSKVLEQKLAAKSLEESAQAAEIATLVNQAVTQSRDLARGLCPVKLEGDGLVQALQELAIKMESLFHVTCLFQCEIPVLIHDNAVATHLYYIAQEAATNAIKHGKAQHIAIGLTVAQDRIILMVKDDGIGFPAREEKQTGMGLHIMNYRASMIDAYLAIQPNAEGGTVVTCSLQHKEIHTHGKKKTTKKSGPARVKKERRHDRETRTRAQEK